MEKENRNKKNMKNNGFGLSCGKEREPHYFVEDDFDLTTNCGKLPEFNLSDKIFEVYDADFGNNSFLKTKDVKEFIKRRNKIIQQFLKKEISCARMWLDLDKLSGKILGK